MGDTYTEQLVKRKNTGKTMVEKIALILLTIGIFVLGMMIPLLELVFLMWNMNTCILMEI